MTCETIIDVSNARLLRAFARHAQKIATAVGMVAVLLYATPIAAQSLSELSRQMEQKRSAAALDELLAYPHRAGATYFGSSEAVDLIMTVPLVQRMAAAWSAVLRIELKDLSLARRYRQAALAATDASDLERVIGGEPAVRGVLAANGTNVHEFVTAMLAYQLVTQVRDRKYPPGLVDYGYVGPNARFLVDHRSEVDGPLRAAARLEQDLDAALDGNARK
jgi:hypothetical protein